jgi:hypothetical protein
MRLLFLSFLAAAILPAQTYDLVIANGRVIDPETNLDGVRSVGITGGAVAAVSAALLQGRAVLDAKGLVVAQASSTCMNTAGFRSSHVSGARWRHQYFANSR